MEHAEIAFWKTLRPTGKHSNPIAAMMVPPTRNTVFVVANTITLPFLPFRRCGSDEALRLASTQPPVVECSPPLLYPPDFPGAGPTRSRERIERQLVPYARRLCLSVRAARRAAPFRRSSKLENSVSGIPACRATSMKDAK